MQGAERLLSTWRQSPFCDFPWVIGTVATSFGIPYLRFEPRVSNFPKAWKQEVSGLFITAESLVNSFLYSREKIFFWLCWLSLPPLIIFLCMLQGAERLLFCELRGMTEKEEKFLEAYRKQDRHTFRQIEEYAKILSKQNCKWQTGDFLI